MRPSRDEMLMEIAHLVAQRSTCSRKQVGAVIAREGRMLTSGYNGAPAGMDHCDHYEETEDIIDGFGNFVKTVQKYPDRGCTIAVHAEANAIAYAARYGISTSQSTLYTTLSPCLACAQLVINSGVERVVCWEMYRDIIGVSLLKAAGLEVDVVDRDE